MKKVLKYYGNSELEWVNLRIECEISKMVKGV